jgi:hypothetical protein
MLQERLRNAWRACERTVAISPVLTLAPRGLLLGAGTVLLPTDGPRRLKSLEGQEAKVLALLSAAYGKAIAPSVLGHIERAAKAWSEGDDCLAYIHLAHARLPALHDPYDAAWRLFIVDGFLKAGTSPRAVFEALHFGAAYIGAVEKLFNPAEPRVPVGSGRTSGEWTDSEGTGGDGAARGGPAGHEEQGSSVLGRAPLPLAGFLGELNAVQAAELGAYALRVLSPAGAAAALFGLLFIPSPNNLRVEGEVPEIPGLRYSWNRDELALHLTYDHAGAQRTFAAYLDDDVFRDEGGRVIGRVIGDNNVAVDLFAVLPDLMKMRDEPRMCPAPEPDVPGSDRGLQYEEDLAKQYEDFLKPLINPDAPTPSGYSYYLPYPDPRKEPVSYDDCQRKTSILFEFKGYYGGLLAFDSNARESFLSQSLRQIEASGGRPVVWIFADREDACALKSYLKTPAKDANTSQSYMCLGRRGADDRAILQLLYSLWLERAGRNSRRPGRQIREDARFVERDRFHFCQLGTGSCF